MRGRGALLSWAAKENVQAVFILLVLLNIFFFPFIWGNKTLLLSARHAASIMPGGAASDAPPLNLQRTFDPGGPAWGLEPMLGVTRHAYLEEKMFPLWNPYNGYGAPLAAAMQWQALHPLTVLLSLDPTPTTFALFLVARLLIAGIFSYLFLRLFVPHLPALAGGVAYMFTGYFIIYLNMFHVTVEMMLPAVFYSFELLYRRFDARILSLCSVMVFLSIIGGAPESTFLVLVFGYLYFLYRTATGPTAGAGFMKQIGRLALVNILGFGLAALQLLPFLEFIARGLSLRTVAMSPGLVSPIVWRELLGYLVPLVEGPPLSNVGTVGVYGYFGMTATVLAVLEVATWIRERRTRPAMASAALVPFFAVAVVLLILKRVGVWPAQGIGYLPFFRIIVLHKYLEPLIAFGVAVLCAFGFSRVVGNRLHAKTAVIALGIVLAMFLSGCLAFLHDAATGWHYASMFFEWTAAGLLVFLVVAIILLAAIRKRSEGSSADTGRKQLFSGAPLLVCLAGELLLIFIYPMFYGNKQPDKRANPFSGSPYISWLQQRDPKTFRIFARDGFLVPNWSGVFGLSDIRNLDAIYEKKYLFFVRAFFAPQVPGPDLFDRFTGMTLDYSFRSANARRLLQLSSVRYLMTNTAFDGGNNLIRPILESANRANGHGEIPLGEDNWTIAGQTKHILVQHPPSSPKGVKVRVEPGRTELHFSIGLNPAGYGGTCGDGVDFMIDERDGSGAVHHLFHRFINPYGNPADRKWFDEKLDLRAYLGQGVELLLSTGPGPKGDNCRDWAGWGDLRFGDPVFNLVYNREVQIYEYPEILPRAAVFYGVKTEPTDEDSLRRLLDPKHDIFLRTVVVSSSITPAIARKIDEMNTAPPRKATPANITRQELRKVDIEAKLDQPGLLTLNDTDYPGWRADVDGREVPIVNVNYLFRGVFLEKGSHQVRFRYEPASFHWGLAASLLSLMALVMAARFPKQLQALDDDIMAAKEAG
jgi:hypothetical protein